jgi:hypothetical protein
MQDEIEDQVQSVTDIADNTEAEEPLTPPSVESAPIEPIEEETVSVVSSNNVEEKPKAKKWKVKRDTYAETYALASEVEALRQRNASMEELLHKSLEAGNYHYGTVAMGLLDKAKANLAKALGEGDVEAVATATAEIAHATSIVNDAKRAPQVNLRDNGGLQEPVATAGNSYTNENMLYDWLEDNPDLDKRSNEYNENLTKQVLPFISKLENRLKRNNQMHLIASPEYFNIIDEYVDKIKDEATKTKQETAPVKKVGTTQTVKEPIGKHFGGVRSRHQPTNVVENRPIALTPQQKKAAAAFHMTEEKYISYLQKYAKEARG